MCKISLLPSLVLLTFPWWDWLYLHMYKCSQCENRQLFHVQTQGGGKIPILTCIFMSESPLFLTQWSGNHFILNVRTSTGSEQHCRNHLAEIPERCQNPMGYMPTPGILTGASYLLSFSAYLIQIYFFNQT